jgi:hypothetical protein
MKISQLLHDHEPSHSSFQLEHFLLGRNGHTVYGCYKQVLREMVARLPSLVQIRHKMISGLCFEFAPVAEYSQVMSQIDQIEFRDRVREFSNLCSYAVALKQTLGELSPERKRELEMEYWTHYTKCLIARDFLAEGRITSGTIEVIHSLPFHCRAQVLGYLTHPSDQDALITWYFANQFQLPELSEEVCCLAIQLTAECLGMGVHDCHSFLDLLPGKQQAPQP